jgi:hypothetical protein
VHLTGNFGVAAQQRGFRIVPSTPLRVGSWKEQNLPFYSDSVSYTGHFRLEREARYKVVLGRWAGSVAEVRVNGKSAGVIGWQPYEVSLDPVAKAGDNVVEVLVTGSLKNLLGPHHGNITRGLASPGNVRNAPAQMPPGSKYDLFPYGLMEDFQVIRIN